MDNAEIGVCSECVSVLSVPSVYCPDIGPGPNPSRGPDPNSTPHQPQVNPKPNSNPESTFTRCAPRRPAGVGPARCHRRNRHAAGGRRGRRRRYGAIHPVAAAAVKQLRARSDSVFVTPDGDADQMVNKKTKAQAAHRGPRTSHVTLPVCSTLLAVNYALGSKSRTCSESQGRLSFRGCLAPQTQPEQLCTERAAAPH